FVRYSNQSRPKLLSRRLQYTRHTSTKLAGEKRRQFVFARRKSRKSVSHHRKNGLDSARAGKSGQSFRSSCQLVRDHRKRPGRFLRSENRARFAQPGQVPQRGGKERRSPESPARLWPTDRAGNADRVRNIWRAGLRQPCG